MYSTYFFILCYLERKEGIWITKLNVRDNNLVNLFEQFQIQVDAKAKNVWINNDDPELNSYLNGTYNVYLHMVDSIRREIDLSQVNTIFVNKESASQLENGIQDEQRLLELLLKRFPNLRVVLITNHKGAYYKDKDMMIYQKELTPYFSKDTFLVKYMTSELKGNSEMTSLYRGVNQ